MKVPPEIAPAIIRFCENIFEAVPASAPDIYRKAKEVQETIFEKAFGAADPFAFTRPS